MSITDELRKWAEDNTLRDRVLTTYPPQHAVHGVLETLLRIADRIDEAHEYAIAYVDEQKHPVDADGNVIYIGDELVLQHEVAGTPSVVQSITWDGEDWYFTCDEGFFNACGWSHYHEPTVEDVLREFAEKMNENMGMYTGEAIDADEWRIADSATISEYAAKLRKLGVDDG